MRIAALIATAGLMAGMATAGPAEEEFPEAMEALKEARELARQCLAGPDYSFARPNCYDPSAARSHEGCVAFDNAMQIATKPLGICADRIAEDPEDAACDEYLDKVWSECTGHHAVYLAHRDRARSKDYDRAVNNGMEETRAAEIYLGGLVRKRK